MPTKWFEWNKQNLNQFDDALVVGPSVTASGFSFIADDGGVSFIEITVTAGAHANGALSQAVLLITRTPPNNMAIVADVISVASVNAINVGGGVVARYVAVNQGYFARLNNTDGSGNGFQLMSKFAGTVGAPTIGQLPGFDAMDDPAFSNASKVGMRVGVGVEGSWIRQMVGEEQDGLDQVDPHPIAGKAGIAVTCSGIAGTQTVRFKNICGYAL